MAIKHAYQSATPDDPGSEVSSSEWNADHVIDELILPLGTSPTTPPADNLNVFGRNVGGRMMLAIKGPSGLDTSLQPHLGRNKVKRHIPQGNSTTAIEAAGITLTATGTPTAGTVGVATLQQAISRILYAVATAATTAVAGGHMNAAQHFIGSPGGKIGGFHFIWRFGPSTGAAANTTRRGFCGFTSGVAAPTDADPSTQANVLGVGCDASDTTWHFMHRNGTGTVVKVNTGITKSAADFTEAYELAMFCPPGGTAVQMTFTNLTADVVAAYEATGSLPTATTLLAPRAYFSVGGTSSAIGLAHMGLYIETDY